MISVAVCDDNKPMLEHLCLKITELFAENSIECTVKEFASGEDVIEAHKRSPFDVVFLDIAMPGLDGFETSKELKNTFQGVYIIFVTTESSLVYESFDYQPFHFVPKGTPELLEKRLAHVIKKLAIHISSKHKIKLQLPYDEVYYADPLTILYLKSNINHVEYYFTDRDMLRIRRKLDDATAELSSYIFSRIHNRVTVNMSAIKRVDYPNLEITLNDNTVLNISRSLKAQFEKAYALYLKNYC